MTGSPLASWQPLPVLLQPLQLAARIPLPGGTCAIDRTLTAASLPVVMGLLLLSLLGLAWLTRLRPHLPAHLAVMALGVLFFELFTAPMWDNAHLGRWAYLYRDVSWILTLAWTVLFLLVVTLVDRLRPRWRALPRFALSLGLITAVTVPAETVLVAAGIRGYAPEVRDAAVGGFSYGVPVAILYYVPVFASLVLGFYRYWSLVIDGALLIPMRRIHWRRGLLLTTAVVLLFELMVEPMVVNRGYPAWANVHRDINLFMTGLWVLVIALTALVVNRVYVLRPPAFRMVLAVLVATAIALPIEYGLFVTGMRVYGPSATANFSGFTIPVLQAPVEIAFAIPCYLALVLASIRYWDLVIDNRL
ncbi:MAG: hypothetical protein ACKO0M_14665 [Cyanobium sp.]